MNFTLDDIADIQRRENVVRNKEGRPALKIDGLLGPKTHDGVIDRFHRLAPDVINPPVQTFEGIIDINHQNGFEIEKLWAGGIRAVYHKGSEGTYMSDIMHNGRRTAWKARGGKWGSYQWPIKGQSVLVQGTRFLDNIQLQKGDRIGIDWENKPGGGDPPTPSEVVTMGRLLHDKTGVLPDLYFGNAMTDIVGRTGGVIPPEFKDDFDYLATMAPWFVHPGAQPSYFPWNIYPKGPFLWQNREGGIPGSDGADGSVFFGTEAELTAQWPT